MPDTVTIRPATAADHRAIVSIVEAAYAVYVPRMGRKPGPMLDDFAKRIRNGEAFVAEADGRVAGALVLIALDASLLLDNIAVDPAAQGKGVGRALVAFAEAEAVRRSYREIRLYTHEKMVENIALYPRLGYRETHRVTEKGYSRVYFAKDVS